MFHRIISVFIIGLILTYTVGYFPIYKLEQGRIATEIKTRIKKSVPVDELHLITFTSLREIVWIKPGKEFKLGNHLYDVVQDVSEKGKISYLCINDVEESLLFARLDELVSRLMDNDGNPIHKSGKQIVKLISPIQYFVELIEVDQPHDIEKETFPETYALYESEGLKVPLPPPELAV